MWSAGGGSGVRNLSGLIVALVCLVVLPARAQVALTVSNSNFELGAVVNTAPQGWVLVVGSQFWTRQMPFVSNGFCNINVPDRTSGFFGCFGFVGTVASPLTALGGAGGFLSWQVQAYTSIADSLFCGVEFFDVNSVSLGVTESASSISMTVGAWANYTCPGFSIPSNADSFRIRLRHTANAAVAYDDLTNVSASSASGSGGGGPGGGGGSTTIDWTQWPGDASAVTDWEDAVGLSQAVQDIQAELANFTCPKSLLGRVSSVTDTVSSVVSVIGGLLGGGAQVIQLIKILNNAKKQLKNGQELLCEAVTQTEILEAVFEGITIDKDTGTIILDQPQASDPAAEDLAVIYDATIGSLPVGGDDTVTAVNKTNKILVAAAMANAEAWDRALGGQRLPYELDRGPLITDADIVANEPNLVYAEGNFAQNYGRFDQEREAAGVAPDWSKHLGLGAAAVDVNSCLTNEAPPSGTGVAAAWATVRWNARQTFAGSELGALLCDLVDNRNTATTGNLCLFAGPGYGFTVPTFGRWELIPPSGYCVAGNGAPGWTAGVWAVMPNIMMLLAAFGLVKRLF